MTMQPCQAPNTPTYICTLYLPVSYWCQQTYLLYDLPIQKVLRHSISITYFFSFRGWIPAVQVNIYQSKSKVEYMDLQAYHTKVIEIRTDG
ncbi:hypothetical protein VN97_g1886 [Penicillium thymicola]|uniref:Uncharacterized protein n=1 Tax=Penicillium thymicola TaxID=293382 RepID=A0AAI9TRF5_PENTH|nr:hypothetical protein VN97_g1886 [Penicillium thymicola]